MVNENYSHFAKMGPDKRIYLPHEPEKKNTEKREKEGKGTRAREKNN